MFTGIVEEVGKVCSIDYSPVFQITVQSSKVSETLNVSDSVCLNGVCLTVTEVREKYFTVQVMPQTLKKTNLNRLKIRDPVNLERALLPTTPLGGHFVTGDIDATVALERVEVKTSQWDFILKPPSHLMRYVVNQGRVALEGVSLTVAERSDETFRVCLIPYTLDHTTLKYKKEKDILNLEVDIIAKYLDQIIQDKEKRTSTGFQLGKFID